MIDFCRTCTSHIPVYILVNIQSLDIEKVGFFKYQDVYLNKKLDWFHKSPQLLNMDLNHFSGLNYYSNGLKPISGLYPFTHLGISVISLILSSVMCNMQNSLKKASDHLFI